MHVLKILNYYLCLKVVTEQFISNHPNGLSGMYSEVLDFIPKKCKCLTDITSGGMHGQVSIYLFFSTQYFYFEAFLSIPYMIASLNNVLVCVVVGGIWFEGMISL